MNELLGKMIALAADRHKNQLDKSGVPYILHCLTVMNGIIKKFPKDYELQCIAVCHDIIEDTKTTFEELKELGATGRVLQAINALTKHKGQTYEEYVEALCRNSDAMMVKQEDLRHNSDITRLKGITEKDFERIKKYNLLYDRIKYELLPWAKKNKYVPFME